MQPEQRAHIAYRSVEIRLVDIVEAIQESPEGKKVPIYVFLDLEGEIDNTPHHIRQRYAEEIVILPMAKVLCIQSPETKEGDTIITHSFTVIAMRS